MAVCLEESLSGGFNVSKTAMIAAGTVLAILLNNVLKIVLLIMLISVLVKQFKSKDEGGKAAVIIVSVLSACLFAYLAYAFCDALKTLLIEWDNKSYMAYVSRYVWANAKLFGTMDNLEYLGGSTVFFSLLWLIGFLGIIPAVIIVAALMFLAAILLKNHTGKTSEKPITNLALIYFCVCSAFAVLANCGVFFGSFMTPMPLIMDTVAGMLCVFSLFGIRNAYLNKT